MLHDINDWPEASTINLRNDRVVIISVAQTNARNYGYDFKPWTLAYEDPKIGFQEAKFKIKKTKSSPHFPQR